MMAMAASLLLGGAVLLFALPACLDTRMWNWSGLSGRIDAEQFARYERAFQDPSLRRRWPVIDRLRNNRERAETLARLAGMDWQEVERRLSRLRWGIAVEDILLAKLAAAGLLVAGVGYLLYSTVTAGRVGTTGMLGILTAVLLFLSPTWLLEQAEKRAREQIRHDIPLFFSIIVSLVEAGMPIHTAMRATARRFPGRLGREIARLDWEEKRYGNWRKALEEMACRWNVDGLITIVSEINEAITKGVPVAAMLAAQVEEQLRQQEDEAAARVGRLTVRMLPVVIVFMGVPLFFLVMGPAFAGMKSLF